MKFTFKLTFAKKNVTESDYFIKRDNVKKPNFHD